MWTRLLPARRRNPGDMASGRVRRHRAPDGYWPVEEPAPESTQEPAPTPAELVRRVGRHWGLSDETAAGTPGYQPRHGARLPRLAIAARPPLPALTAQPAAGLDVAGPEVAA